MGAQVLEQEESQVAIFADVDLSADEVVDDFAHSVLPRRPEFGTVGLWCLLHGEAFLDAGMHHLECRFDFAGLRGSSLSKPVFASCRRSPISLFSSRLLPKLRLGRFSRIGRMQPFARLRLLQNRPIGFAAEGPGFSSRNPAPDHGYKGFNQTGINEMIRADIRAARMGFPSRYKRRARSCAD